MIFFSIKSPCVPLSIKPLKVQQWAIFGKLGQKSLKIGVKHRKSCNYPGIAHCCTFMRQKDGGTAPLSIEYRFYMVYSITLLSFSQRQKSSFRHFSYGNITFLCLWHKKSGGLCLEEDENSKKRIGH